MLRILIVALGLCAVSALRIQAKKKEAPLPNKGASGTISFGRISAPIYDTSDEPFQNIHFARGKTHGKTDDVGANDIDGPAEGFDGGISVSQKKKIIANAMKDCTPENSNKAAQENPEKKIPADWFSKSSLPMGSFYAKQAAQHSQSSMGCSADACQVPTYLAPREGAKESQTIPRVIWMTMSDDLLAGKIGPFQYSMMAQHFKQNPEYEFVVSGDAMSDAFMKSDEVKPEWTEAYAQARNGAEKADIWRYAVLHKYGGVYMDTDMTAIVPYKTFIDSQAHIVQQCTEKGSVGSGKFETSQYALFMAPGSKLLEGLLDDIAAKYKSGTSLPLTIALTGPRALGEQYGKLAVCGVKVCSGGGSGHLCGVPADSCEDPELGKVVLLHQVRDFNTGKVWHKSDVCALAETRSKFSHWAQQAKGLGGKGFEETARA